MHYLLNEIDFHLDGLIELLDTDDRAWVLGGVVLLEELRNRTIERVPLDSLVKRAFDEDDFPAVPFPFTPGDLEWTPEGEFDCADSTVDVNGTMALDVKLATDRRCAVGEALTRHRLDDGSLQPTHVMLSDVEAVLIDCMSLARALAAETGYAGPALLLLEIECRSDQPLELRAYEGNGEVLRPAAGYNFFAPMRLPFTLPLNAEEEAELLWDVARDLSLQFGVVEPQLIRDPLLHPVH